jgi:hypothetical protein
VGHVARMEYKNVYVLVAKPQRKRSLQKPRDSYMGG